MHIANALRTVAVLLCLVGTLAGGATSAISKPFKEMFPGVEIKDEKARALLDGMDFQQGKVSLNAGGVTIDVPPKYYLLGPVDARKVLVDLWRNPPASTNAVLGLLVPASKMPIQDTWAAVLRFDDDGHVSDDDAKKIDYDQLLKEMQASTDASNEDRQKAGYPRIRLVGWAAQPYYDDVQKKLHWAKELEFGGSQHHTLNYDVRALGRRGVLKMNFVAGIDELPVIRSVIPDVMEMASFEQGSRYTDYLPGVDKVAAYGIGGLIAGKLIAKTGLLALGLVFLKKFGVIAVIAIGAALRSLKGLFSRNK